MSQYKAIPQPTDQRNVSQNDILTNFQYLSTPLNPTAGVPNGILPVDHFASGDNVANPTDGFHKQISFQDRATPGSLTNATNSQASSGIQYSKTDGAGNSQVRYTNASLDLPMTYLMAAVNFDGTGAIVGNAVNVTSVTKNIVGPLSGSFTVNFTTNLPSVNYLVLANTESGSMPPTPTTSVTSTKAVSSVTVYFQNSTNGVTRAPSGSTVMVFGFF